MQFLVFLTLLLKVTLAFTPEKKWQNDKFLRSINLSKSYVKEHFTIEITNIDTQPNDEYYLALPTYIFERLSVYTVVDGSAQPDPITGQPVLLDTEIIEDTTEVNGESVISYLKVSLSHPVAPKQTFKLGVSLTVLDVIEPIPSQLEITDEQTLLLKTFKAPLSAYDTITSELDIIGVASGKELSVSEQEFNQKGKVIDNKVHFELGALDSLKLSTFAFVYTFNQPLVHITDLVRGVWVSHWANTLQVEEFYKLTNKAASLKNGFSRLDFMLNSKKLSASSHSLNVLEVRLLDDSKDVYYTDLVGNVSTSRAFPNKVYLKPRYPVFGGWNYNFTIGWTNKLSSHLRLYDTEEYILKVPIINGPAHATYDKVELSFYLPEGAQVLEIESPIAYDSVENGYELSYFDLNSGHTKVTLTYSNLIDELSQLDVLVRYRYSSWSFIRKPLDVAKFIFIALVSYLLITKIDISLKAKK